MSFFFVSGLIENERSGLYIGVTTKENVTDDK